MNRNHEANLLDQRLVMAIAPKRAIDGHKGTFGTLGVWAGSKGMGGAAFLCANSALRSGVGLLHLWLEKDFLWPMFLALPQLISHELPDSPEETLDSFVSWQPKISAWAVGPGLLPGDERVKAGLRKLLAIAPAIVLDAGALSCMAEDREFFREALKDRIRNNQMPAIVTPHPGEFARLQPDYVAVVANPEENRRQRIAAARDFAKEWSAMVVLKGYQTVVADPEGNCFLNETGNNGLAKGGSGDVLCGLIGSFLAQGIPALQAAQAGVYLHGLAGDLAAEGLGQRFMQPTDLFEYFLPAFRRCGWEN